MCGINVIIIIIIIIIVGGQTVVICMYHISSFRWKIDSDIVELGLAGKLCYPYKLKHSVHCNPCPS